MSFGLHRISLSVDFSEYTRPARASTSSTGPMLCRRPYIVFSDYSKSYFLVHVAGLFLVTMSRKNTFSTSDDNDEMQAEIDSLKQNLEDLTILYQKLLNDTKDESIDSRRMKLLKAKNIQLERQVQRLTSASDLRSGLLNEIENFVVQFSEDEQPQQTFDAKQMSKWASNVLTKIKSYQVYSKQATDQQFFGASEFTSVTDSAVLGSVQEVCSGKFWDVSHLDLSHIADLEDKISGLYRHLYRLHTTLRSITSTNSFEGVLGAKALSQANEAAKAIDSVREDLLELSLVVPSKLDYVAKIKKPDNTDVDMDRPEEDKRFDLNLSTKAVLQKLPYFSRNKVECEHAIRSLVQLFHMQKNLYMIEHNVLKEERDFYKQCNDFQTRYGAAMIKEIEGATLQYQESTSGRETCWDKVEKILEAYEQFDEDSSEGNLRNLLQVHRQEYDDLKSVTSKEKKAQQRSHQKFQREVKLIQDEYDLKRADMLKKRFQIEEDMLHQPLFMDTMPEYQQHFSIVDPQPKRKASSEKRTKTPLLQSTGSSKSLKSSTTAQKPAPKAKQVDPDTQSLNANVIELQEQVTAKSQQIKQLEDQVRSGELTDMRAYAVTQQIKKEKAALVKLQRTLSSVL